MERFKMKKSTKPISSPGRTTEKFPPPLMRFLRSNAGNKSSRGRRSRASPMFIRKKNTVIETTQEPSSPKVTCIGQVRVRRCKKTTSTTVPGKPAVRRSGSNRHCRCLRKLKPISFHTVFRKWVAFFRCGCCETSRDSHDSPVTEPTPVAEKYGDEEEEEENEHLTVEADNQVLISRSPPRNAFLLTRCRSAPYRSSSLASKFWESTMEKTGEEEVAAKIKNLRINGEDEGVNEVIRDENGGLNEDFINGVEELKAVKAAGPLTLSRCKSEPATTWDKLCMNLS